MSEHNVHVISGKPALFIADRSDGRDNNFNLIRIIAASLVLVAHAYPLSLGAEFGQPFESTLHGLSLGLMSVWAFFAISGFFITRSFDRNPSASSFLIARALRLFPALAVVTVITILVAGLLLTQAPPSVFWDEAGSYFIRNMLLFKLQYTLPGVFESNPYGAAINGSLWSLSYEVTCYVGVLLCGLLGFLGNKKIFAGLTLLFLCFYTVIVVFIDVNPRIEVLTRLGLPFLSGMVFYIWRRHVPLSWSLLALSAALSFMAWFTPLFLPVFAISLSYAVIFAGYVKTPLLLRYNKLGDYSYGVYIYAFPIQQLVAQSGVTTPVLNMAMSFPLSLLCAVLSWHFIEAPAMKLRFPRKVHGQAGTKQAAK